MTVSQPQHTVTVGGLDREATSLSVKTEIATELGLPITGGAGLMGAEATVDWADSRDVTHRARHPWARLNGWPPVPGDEATIDLADDLDSPLLRAFTGRVRETSGSVASGTLSSSLVDALPQLDRPITMPGPLVEPMPPVEDFGPYRHCGFAPFWITEQVLAQCGFHAGPPISEDTVWHSSMCGSTYPTVGTLMTSKRFGYVMDGRPIFAPTPWGMVVCIDPDLTGVSARHPNGSHDTWELTMDMADGFDPAYAGIHVDVTNRDTGIGFGMYIDGNLGITTYSQGPDGPRYSSTVHDASSATRVATRVTGTATGFTMTIRDDKGGEFTATSVRDYGAPAQLDIKISGEGRIGAVQLDRAPDVAWTALNAPRTARFHLPSFTGESLKAIPFLSGRNALDLLAEQSKATLSAMWLDEFGVFHWADPEFLPTQDPDGTTLTSRDDLTDIRWSETQTGPYSKVRVKYLDPAVSRRSTPSLTVWQGRSEGLDRGDTIEEWITPPSGESWVMVDTDVQLAGEPTGGDESFNRGRGSWVGGYPVDADGDASGGWFMPKHGTADITAIDGETFLYTMTVTFLEAIESQIITEPNTASVGLWPKWLGQGLPILRAKGKAVWRDTEQTVDVGPKFAPAWEHDAGWWVQNAVEAWRIRDLIADRITTPQPLLESVDIIADDTLRLGQRVTIEDPDRSGLAVDGIIVRNDRTRSPGSASQQLALRVLTVEVLSGLWGEHTEGWAGNDWDDHDTAWAGQTWGQHAANPLDHAPHTTTREGG